MKLYSVVGENTLDVPLEGSIVDIVRQRINGEASNDLHFHLSKHIPS